MPANPEFRMGQSPQSKPAVPLAALSAERVARLAQVIAEGRSTVPDDLSPSDRKRLEDAVHARLRNRFIQYIVRAVAGDLYRQHPPGEGV